MLQCQEAERSLLLSGKNTKLSDVHNHWFEVIPADTPALREEAYRLRYQVYCCEHAFEIPDEHPQSRETDEFDSRSIHSLLVDRASGVVTGTVRLILPDKNASRESFPIGRICNHDWLSDPERMSTAAEVSRFAISKRQRRIAEDRRASAIVWREDCAVSRGELQGFIVMGLMRATAQMSFQYGITNWFALMEPALLRLLSRFGIYFTPIGPLVTYHGVRQPCHAKVDDLLGKVHDEFYELWEYVVEPSGTFEEVAFASNF